MKRLQRAQSYIRETAVDCRLFDSLCNANAIHNGVQIASTGQGCCQRSVAQKLEIKSIKHGHTLAEVRKQASDTRGQEARNHILARENKPFYHHTRTPTYMPTDYTEVTYMKQRPQGTL